MAIPPQNSRQVVQDAIALEKLEPQPSESVRRSVTVTEPAPFTAAGAGDAGTEDVPQGSGDASISTKGLLLLSSLHLSSTWGDRSINFGVYLILATIFPSTLLPASIYGFCVTGCGIIFSSSAGTAVDKYNRLTVLRSSTLVQKLSAGIVYALCLLFFVTSLGSKHTLDGKAVAAFVAIVISGAFTKVSTVCINICIERDWASTIGGGSSTRLTRLNTWLRRIDLTCDLIAPVFVSGLSAGAGYPFATAFLCGMTVVSLIFEFAISGVVYRAFPELESDQASRRQLRITTDHPNGPSNSVIDWLVARLDLRRVFKDTMEFSKLPVFYASLSIASIYLTVLSFDGNMLTFLKSTGDYSDLFIAGQRAASTVAGLTGTVLFPIVSRKLGLVRTGSWSIWSEFVCLIPVVVALYVGARSSNPEMQHSFPTWNATFLFGGMALSRIFLWMFDLAQLQIVQESLEGHPRRNRIMAFQYTLQNFFDMGKYALVMALAKPSEFRWAALVSVMAVFVGGTLYIFGYARRVRGHIAPHPRWLTRFKFS